MWSVREMNTSVSSGPRRFSFGCSLIVVSTALGFVGWWLWNRSGWGWNVAGCLACVIGLLVLVGSAPDIVRILRYRRRDRELRLSYVVPWGWDKVPDWRTLQITRWQGRETATIEWFRGAQSAHDSIIEKRNALVEKSSATMNLPSEFQVLGRSGLIVEQSNKIYCFVLWVEPTFRGSVAVRYTYPQGLDEDERRFLWGGFTEFLHRLRIDPLD